MPMKSGAQRLQRGQRRARRYRTNPAQLREVEKQQEIAADTLRIARNRYQNGYASYLDELDAQRTLFSAQLNVVQLKNTLLQAQIDLYRALGGGWQP